MQRHRVNDEAPADEERAARSLKATSCVIASAAEIGITPRCETTATISNGLTIVVCKPVAASQNGRTAGCSFTSPPAALYASSSQRAQAPGASVEHAIALGEFALVCVTPARVVHPDFVNLLANIRVHHVIIDEGVIGRPRGCWAPEHQDLINKVSAQFSGDGPAVFRAVKQTQIVTAQLRQSPFIAPILAVSDVFRRHVTFGVEQRSCMWIGQLIAWLYCRRGWNGVIYGTDQVEVDEIAGWLQQLGFRAVRVHDGLSKHVRTAAVSRFNGGGANLAVTPTGDGQWIDRVDLDFALHTRMPSSIEAYLRDTRIADRGESCPVCIIFYSPDDARACTNRVEAYHRLAAASRLQLEQMEAYCRTIGCRHLAVMKHLKQGDVPAGGSEFSCYHCDNCLSRPGACFGDQVVPG